MTNDNVGKTKRLAHTVGSSCASATFAAASPRVPWSTHGRAVVVRGGWPGEIRRAVERSTGCSPAGSRWCRP